MVDRCWEKWRTGRALARAGGSLVLTLALALTTPPVLAIDPEYERIKAAADLVEKQGAELPLDLEFADTNGQPVTLREVFSAGKPVILTLGYYDCPMLCHLVLDGLLVGARKLKWTAGVDFEIVSVSIDPNESAEKSSAWKSKYLTSYAREGADWHFLTGSAESTRRLADAVGFGYVWVAERGEYAHKGVLILCTPDGRVSQYLHGVQFEPETLKFKLLEAGEGEIGSILDRVQFFCYRWDPEEGKYTKQVTRIMQLGGLVTIVGIVLMILLLRKSEPKVIPVAVSTDEERVSNHG